MLRSPWFRSTRQRLRSLPGAWKVVLVLVALSGLLVPVLIAMGRQDPDPTPAAAPQEPPVGAGGTGGGSPGSLVQRPSAGSTDRRYGALALGSAQLAVPPDARHVAPTGNDDAAGTAASPWRTVAKAVRSAAPGKTIVLRGGVYRESTAVTVPNLTLQPADGEAVWFDGADPVTGWVREGSTWRHDGWTTQFQRGGRPDLVDAGKPMAANPDMVFVDGAPLAEVDDRAKVAKDTFFVDTRAQQLVIGNDPTQRLVEASVRTDALTIQAPGVRVRGLGFARFATHVARLAALRGFADDLVFEENVFQQNAAAGATIVGENGRMVHNTATGNGQLGLHANHANGLVLSGNLIEGNNAERFRTDQSAGGIKVTSSRTVRVAENFVRANNGNGIWLDESVLGAAVVGNEVRANEKHGVQFELSAEGVVVGNVITDNLGRGVNVLDSNDLEIWNNTFLRNDRHVAVLEGNRTSSDPQARGHDRRYPAPDARITWDVRRIRIRNNVFGAVRPGSDSVVSVADAQRKRSAEEMEVSADYDAYVQPETAKGVVAWSGWPANPRLFRSVSEARQEASQERSGSEQTPSTFSDDAGRLSSAFRANGGGEAFPVSVASAFGVQPGTMIGVGAIWFTG